MQQLFQYLIDSSIILSLFCIFYLLMLRKETYFHFNRYYLLFSLLFSQLIPLPAIASLLNTEMLNPGIEVLNTIALPSINIAADAPASSPAESSYALQRALFFIYLIPAVFMSGVLFYRIFRTIGLLRKGTNKTILGHNVRLIDGLSVPFTFLRGIALPAVYADETARHEMNDLKKILKHEQAHVEGLHTIDILLCGITSAVQWFNPFVSIMRRELQAQHEFIADRDVLACDPDKYRYGQLLLESSPSKDKLLLANSFNSTLKRRFKMIAQKRSGLYGKLKAFLLVPFTAMILLLSVNATQPVNSTSMQDETPLTLADKMPVFPGGETALMDYILKNTVYPEDAKDAGIEGKVFVEFIVEKDGSVSGATVINGTGSSLDRESLRLVSSMPKWQPGEQGGKPVRIKLVLPFMYKLSR